MEPQASAYNSVQGSSSHPKSKNNSYKQIIPSYVDVAPPYTSQSSWTVNLGKGKASIRDIPESEDALPPYTSTLQLLTLCRRKQTMASEGKKARNRAWEVVWLLIDGTALKLYAPSSDEKKQYLKEWKEKHCVKPQDKGRPVGRSVANVDGDETEEEEEEEDIMEEPANSSIRIQRVEPSRGTTLAGRGRSSSTAKVPISSAPAPVRRPTRQLTLPNSSRPTSTFVIHPHPSLPSILSRKPQKSYPVRNAKCGRPSNYFKRNFVLEFTLDGSMQFLAQLNNYEELLTWLQVMTIATPLALDLDERPMPEPTAYPRPRRNGRPLTAPGDIDTSMILNLPPSYYSNISQREPTNIPVPRTSSL